MNINSNNENHRAFLDLSTTSNDIEHFSKIRRKNFNNPFFSYNNNINLLRNKIIDLKAIVSKTLPDVLVIAETKIDSTFTNAQFF